MYKTKKKFSRKKFITFLFLAFLIILFIVVSLVLSPAELVQGLGSRNSYLIIFFVSFFGGFSAGGSFSFITLLYTLAAGGLNPYYLALVSGTSLAIGDLIMFYTGLQGRELIVGRWDKKMRAFSAFLEKNIWLRRALPLIIFLYIAVSPLPNDLLIFSLAAIEYPFKRMIWLILLGDFSFALLVALLGGNGSSFWF